MKKSIFLILILFCIFATLSLGQASDRKVIVYYFHGHMRCPTCYNMEKYAQEVVEDNFKNELASGKVLFRAVNVEEKANEHFIKDYQLYTKSLILSLVEGNQEIKHKNLSKIWEYVRNKGKYKDYVKIEISNLLEAAQ